MDFDSPEVMKNFPGLYSSEKRKNDSDYNDENEKPTKKDMIIGKKKEKKDKKDKDKGYAALEGESSDESSPCKGRKSKAFKFTKSKDKEKIKKKQPPKEKVVEARPKKKVKLQPKGAGKLTTTEDLAEALPIFGVDLKAATERAKCHDGVLIPLPVRESIDYVEEFGLFFDNVYKINGPKNKVGQIKKMYNNRQTVKFGDYDVPTATGLLKVFLRDLPEPIFTNELLIRFEEAGALLSFKTRGKHLLALMKSLPIENYNVLVWLIKHFHNVTQRDRVNKMTTDNLAQAMNQTLHISTRLLKALIAHREDLCDAEEIVKYHPPLEAGSSYPQDPATILEQLRRLESALNLIHWEMQQGFTSQARQDQLWEVQRVQTDLKRILKKSASQVMVSEADAEDGSGEPKETPETVEEMIPGNQLHSHQDMDTNGGSNKDNVVTSSINRTENKYKNQDLGKNNFYPSISGNTSHDVPGAENIDPYTLKSTVLVETQEQPYMQEEEGNFDEEGACANIDVDDQYDSEDISSEPEYSDNIITDCSFYNYKLNVLHCKNNLLKDTIEVLTKNVEKEKREINEYKKKLEVVTTVRKYRQSTLPRNFDKMRELISSENHMLGIKKIELIRQLSECQEELINLRAQLKFARKMNQ